MAYVGFDGRDGRDGRDGGRDGRGTATSPVRFRHDESKSAGHAVTQAVTLHHAAITVTRSPLSLEEGDRDGCTEGEAMGLGRVVLELRSEGFRSMVVDVRKCP